MPEGHGFVFEDPCSRLRELHSDEIKDLKAQHEQIVENLYAEFDDEKAALEKDFRGIYQALEDKYIAYSEKKIREAGDQREAKLRQRYEFVEKPGYVAPKPEINF